MYKRLVFVDVFHTINNPTYSTFQSRSRINDNDTGVENRVADRVPSLTRSINVLLTYSLTTDEKISRHSLRRSTDSEDGSNRPKDGKPRHGSESRVVPSET